MRVMKIIKLTIKNLAEISRIVVKSIRGGGVVVCPTDTVYGLIGDAQNEKTVRKIFKIKKRNLQKPISLFVKDLEMAKQIARIDKSQEKILRKLWPGKAIVILKNKKKFSKGIVCQWGKIGLRIPKYKLLNELLSKFKRPLAQTSANLAGKPTPAKIEDILKQFGKYKPDLAIDAGRLSGKPSKVVDLTDKRPKILRK